MDLTKIGRFIALCRKNKNDTKIKFVKWKNIL